MVDEKSGLVGTRHYFRAYLRLATDARHRGDIEAASRYITQSLDYLPDLEWYFEQPVFHISAFKADALMSAHTHYEHGVLLKMQYELEDAADELRIAKDLLGTIAGMTTPGLEDPERLADFPEGDVILQPITLKEVQSTLVRVQEMLTRVVAQSVRLNWPTGTTRQLTQSI